MIKFSKNIIRSFIDVPDKISLVIHSYGCNLNCYKCFNYKELVCSQTNSYGEENIINEIKRNGFIVDAVLFSGGEFLHNNIDDITSLLKKVRTVYDGLIVINTNGTYPDKMKLLIELNLVDGFNTDMKLPFFMLDEKIDNDIIKTTIGRNDISINDILQSIEYTIKYDKGYSQVRSVKYPLMRDFDFELNRNYIEEINRKFNKNTKYFINEFIESEE